MEVRPARDTDIDGINRLHREVWWPERSRAGWAWLRSNPGRAATGAPWGWVVPDDTDQPAAFVGNFVQGLVEGSDTWWVATGFSIIVSPSHRGAASRLVRTVLGQPGVRAVYTLNANRLSSGLYARHGMVPWPPTTSALKLSWVVDRAAVLRARAWRNLVARMPYSGLHLSERLMNRRLLAPVEPRLPDGIIPVSDFADHSPYQDFWRRLRATGHPMIDRSAAAVRWRRADPDQTTAPLTLACLEAGEIVGVIQCQLAKGSSVEPPILEVIDLVWLPHAEAAPPRLMRAVIGDARRMGAAKVRLQVVGPALLTALGGLLGSARHEGGWQHGHAWFEDVSLSDRWMPTPFDGDHGLCLRPIPTRPTAA